MPHERFDRVLEWSRNDNSCSITGVIHFSELLKSDWWKQKNVSLILFPESILEDYEPEKAEMELAGIAFAAV